MRKITFGTQEEKDAAIAEAKANQEASATKHANWIESVESAEVVPE
jgi:hypothetical protein